MPPLTRWYIRTALLYFVLSLLAGLALALRVVVALPAAFAALQPVYFHLFMVGWVAQLIFGMVHWMFPKYSTQQPRGNEALGWATYGLLNAGLVLRAIGEPWAAAQAGGAAGWLLAASAILQLLAGWAFVAITWPRVREK